MFGRTTLSQRVDRLESEVATIRRLYETSIAYSDSDPRSALMNARLAAEAVCARVLEKQTGESPKGQTLQTLVQRLTHKKAAPEQVLIALSTIQRYGNFGSHHQAGEPQNITPEFAQPCLQALGQVVRWYFSEHGDPHISGDPPARSPTDYFRRTIAWGLGSLLLAAAVGMPAWHLSRRHGPEPDDRIPKEQPTPPPSEGSRRATIAVLPFECLSAGIENAAGLQAGVGRVMTTRLEKSGLFEVVQRARLDAVLAELELSNSTKFDPAGAARIGKLLGAKRLVLGSIFTFGRKLRMDATVVETETGRVLCSEESDGPADDIEAITNALCDALISRHEKE